MGFSKYPIGVYDHPSPADTTGVSSVNIGDSRAAKVARAASKAINDLDGFLNDLNPLP